MIFAAFMAEPMVDLPELAHDWFGLATWALIAVAVLAAAVVWIRREHKNTQGELKGVAKNVAAVAHSVNNRPDTTRDQLDRIERNQAKFQETVTAEIRGLRKDVGRLADGAQDDRAMHHRDVARLDGDIEELRGIATGKLP